MNSIFFYLIFLSYLSVHSLLAQEKRQWVVDTTDSEELKVKVLEEVLVTATRTIRQLSSLPMPAQIISKKEIQAINSVRLSDVLNEQTGLITIPDFGGGEGIQLQGLNSEYILVLIDGMPLVGRSAGTLDLSRISIGNIKQLEIIKGASSSLYGNEALGGIINIITEIPKNSFNGNFNYRVGTFNTHDISNNLSYKKNKFGITTFINRYSSQGYDLTDGDALNTVEPFENYTLNTKLTYDFTDKTSLLLSGRYYYQKQDNVASKTLLGKSKINDWNGLLKLNHTFNKKWSSYLEFYTTQYTANEYLNDSLDRIFNRSDFDQLFVRPEFRTTYALNKKHTFTGGLGLTYEKLNRTDFYNTPTFKSSYVYVQYEGYVRDDINVIVGTRFDHHNAYESRFSPKAALHYQKNKKVALKGSIGFGFKAPDFRQLYFDFTNATVGYTILGYHAVTTRIPQLQADGELVEMLVPVSKFSEKLRAENSLSYNLGADYDPFNNLTLNINLFRNDIHDLIDTRVIARKANGQNVFTYYNVDKMYTQGIEFNTSWKLKKNITISGGYQLLYTKDKEAEKSFENGKVFARLTPSSPAFQLNENNYFGLFNRSTHTANFKIFYHVPKWNMNVNLRGTYRSKYGLIDTNGNTFLDDYDVFVAAYSIWDVAFNKTFYDNYQISFGIDNLFDFTNPKNISNISGRLTYGKIHINF